MDTNIKRGDIFYADLSPVVGSEQGGTRPVLIVQNDTGNRHSPTVIAAAITSQTGKAKLPTHISLTGHSAGLTRDSVVLLEQIRTIDKRRLREHMGHALIESDEAAFKAISKFVDAKTVVVTNVFRDQLDRYGEVTHTLDNIRIGLTNSKNALVLLNADDSLCTSLADDLPNKVLFYGVDTPIYHTRVKELSDAPYCIRCKSEYVYDYVTYGHLGKYRCPVCGYHRPDPSVSVSKILVSDQDHSVIDVKADGVEYETNVNLPGGYNIYNACSAMAAGKAMGLDLKTVSKSLSEFACGFGRMEKFRIHETDVRMILIKNPAGCNQVLNFLTERKEPFVFAACLNDRAQDGKDVSWIWDVDFERLTAMGGLVEEIYVSGVRAEDMVLRFKYAGFPVERLHGGNSAETDNDFWMKQPGLGTEIVDTGILLRLHGQTDGI